MPRNETKEVTLFEFGCPVILVTNAKGGVGKTTVATNLAAALGTRKKDPKKCLLVDADPNCGLTRNWQLPETEAGIVEGICGKTPIADLVFRHDDPTLREAEEGSVYLPKNVDVLGSCRALDGIERDIREMGRFFDPTSSFGAKLEVATQDYDYCFLDVGPGMTLASHICFELATFALLVAEPSPRSTEALGVILEDLEMVRAGRNSTISLLGVIVTKAPSVETLVMRQQLKFLAEGLPEASGLFPVNISAATAVPESQSRYTTVVEDQRSHKVSRQFIECAKELEARIERAKGAS